MPIWVMVLIGIIIFDIGFIAGSWWRGNFADEDFPTTELKGADADTARYMLNGKM